MLSLTLSFLSLSLSLIHYLRYTLLHSFIHSRPNEHCHTFNSTLMCPISYSFVFSLPLISHTFESFLSPCVYSSLIPLSLSASYSSYVPISLIPLTSTLSLIFILFITHLDKHSYAINILVPPLKIQDLILPPFNYVLLSPYTYMWAKLGHFLFIFVLFTMQ